MNSKNFFAQKDEEEHKHWKESYQIINKKCRHKEAKYANGELRCPCGAAWRGPRIAELVEKLGGQYV